MSTSYSIKSITPTIQHAEGPHWDHVNQILYYVDTFQATIYRWDSSDQTISSHKLENYNSVGVVLPIKDKGDEFVVASDRDMWILKWPRDANETLKANNETLTLARVDREKPTNQFNDGKVDSRGRIWLGTLTRNKDLSVSPNGGALYMFTNGKDVEEHLRISNTSISNGLAWSKDNNAMYFIDSMTKTVVGYEYNEESGKISNKRTVFDLEKSDIKGIPDGMTIDENDHLWVALFGGHSILNIDPVSGELIRVIEVPVTYVTSVCFGGPNLDILYATTSRLHVTEEELIEEPLAGSILAIENLGVKGLLSKEPVFY